MSRSRHTFLPVSLRGVAALALLVAASTGCQRGEKSCRYYSIVLERSDAPEERKHALDQIKRMNGKDQVKCDDDKVFDRFGKAMGEARYRPTVIETLENLGRAGGKLRERSEKLLVSGLGKTEGAGQIATVFRTWRLESAEGKDPWAPSPATTNALAAAIKRIPATQPGGGAARASLVEALFLSVTDAKERAKYEDLLVELADTDPSQQSVDVNIKALQYLTEMRTQGEPAFKAYIHGLFQHDAARSETYMAARLALATMPRQKVADQVLGIFTQKDAEFEAWTKQAGLFPWEWQLGPKTMQLLTDLHLPSTAVPMMAVLEKDIREVANKEPREWKLINKSLPWGAYVVSRFQIANWTLASLGKGTEAVADRIVAVAVNSDAALEQRRFLLMGLALSGATNGWASTLKVYKTVPMAEKALFVEPLLFALDTQNLDEWNSTIATEKDPQTAAAVADPTIKGALHVVEECKKAEDAAPDKQKALIDCYVGFLSGGDNIAKQKAAINLVHLGARGADVVKPLLTAFGKASPAQDGVTIRQVIMAGLRNLAKPEHIKDIYHTQQLQIQDLPNSQSWIWDFDVLLSQLLPEAEAAGVLNGKPAAPVAVPAAAGATPTPAPTPAPAQGGAAPAVAPK